MNTIKSIDIKRVFSTSPFGSYQGFFLTATSILKFRKKITGDLITGLLGLSALIVVIFVIVIMSTIIHGGWRAISWEFLTAAPKHGMEAGGIFPAIFGTFLLVMIMSVAVIPIGTITALYMAEYSKSNSWFFTTIRFAVNTLAGIPSIVFGLFGLGFFIQFVGTGVDSVLYGKGTLVWGQPNILWASLTMALLTLPVVIVSVEEAIRAVPQELRQASLALGASKWYTIRHIVLPQSLTGILTGGILAVSRGAGEVAPILFTGAAYFLPELPGALTDQFMELGYHIYIMSTQSTDVEGTRSLQYATTLVLLTLTFTLNFSALIFRYKIRKRQRM
ncbi:MAG: phosphate ABC transporter permease PstA [Chitinivibrionales bacterium]|nr:phosphate ABC transporter permease PstA [Chitinivibrionales bacterium]